MVKTLVWPIQTVLGANALLTEGARTELTCKVALASLVLVMSMPLSSASLAVKAPIGMVLSRLPAVVEVTSMDTWQEPGVVLT